MRRVTESGISCKISCVVLQGRASGYIVRFSIRIEAPRCECDELIEDLEFELELDGVCECLPAGLDFVQAYVL